jgi:Peptidase family M1 domain
MVLASEDRTAIAVLATSAPMDPDTLDRIGQHEPMGTRRPIALAAVLALLAVALPQPAARAATTTEVTQRYDLTMTLDVAAGVAEVVEVLSLTNRASESIDHVNLSVIPRALGYYGETGEVAVDGEPVTTTWTTTTNLHIPLGRELAPHDTTVIRIPFRLTIGTSRDAFSARLSRENGVVSFGEWFPILSREHDSYGLGDPQVSFNADLIKLDLTTTSPLARDAVACPGLVSAPATAGTRWTCEAGNVRDFSFVVNPAFRLTERMVGLTEMRAYTQTVDGSVTADLAEAALISLNEAYGRYPWPDLVLAEVGTGGGFSMEFPRAIHLTRTKVTDPYVVNHEVAHQWFYAQVGNDQMLEPWLDEGFADFSARYLMGIGEDQCSARAVDSQVFAWEAGLIDGGDWQSCDGYFHTVFYKGTEFLNALRAAMGEEAFFASLRDFVSTHRYDVVTAAQLLAHFQASTDASLDPIYTAYLAEYQPGADGERPGQKPPPRGATRALRSTP